LEETMGGPWAVVAVLFAFMLLHQTDKLLLGPLTTEIMNTFHIGEDLMGLASTAALLVGLFLYPLWGYLADRFARPALIALASFIWGATTWLSAIAPTYPLFLLTRASTGIDDNAYPSLYSLISDYFGPQLRSRIYGFLQMTGPVGYLMGVALALGLKDLIGWRAIYLITGSLGLVMALLIWRTVREVPRGRSEPELAALAEIPAYRFNLNEVRALLRKPTFLFLVTQGFFGVFPWNVISFWFFRYLEVERGYSNAQIFVVMASAVIVMSLGYLAGGAMGDWLFRRTLRGRLIVSMAGVLAGAVLLAITMSIPPQAFGAFWAMVILTAFTIPLAAPNVLATVFDISPPEIRGSAHALESFIEGSGASLAPFLTGLLAVRTSLHTAILTICVGTWLLCGFLFALAIWSAPRDIMALRAELRARAAQAASGS
jgi:MFS family permease